MEPKEEPMSDSIEVDGLIYGPLMIRAMRIDLEAARAEAERLQSLLDETEQARDEYKEQRDCAARERNAARAEAEQLRHAHDTVIVDGLTYGEHMTRDLRAQLAQRDRDWDALVKLIATSVGTEEDRDCAENDELAEFDPWHALRTRAAEAEQLRAERDALENQFASLVAKTVAHPMAVVVENETAEAIATWLDGEAKWLRAQGNPYRHSENEETDAKADAAESFAESIREGQWRTTKGDAGK